MGNHHGTMFASVHHGDDVMNSSKVKYQSQQQQQFDGDANDDNEMNEELTRMVKEQEQVDENEMKNGLPYGVILLGSTDSGKSTLWNRWKLQTQALSQTEKLEFSNLLLTYIITALKRLVDKAQQVLTQHDYQDLYSKHDFAIDLMSQIIGSNSPFEYLFVTPVTRTKMQSLWIDHDFLSHLPPLFMEKQIQNIYTSVQSQDDESVMNTQTRSDDGIVNELLLGNYLHYFLQNESFLKKLSDSFTYISASSIKELATSPTTSSYLNSKQSTNLSAMDILKSKVVTTSINTLKFQYSKRSVSTKVIKVIERRKRSLSNAAVTSSSTPQPSSVSQCQSNTPTISIHGKSGSIAIPKLVLNENVITPKEERSLLPKSARGSNSMTPRSNSLTGKTINIPSSRNSSEMDLPPANSPPKKSATKKLVESLVRKRSSSNSSNSEPAKQSFLGISPNNSPRSSNSNNDHSPVLCTSPSGVAPSSSPNFSSLSSSTGQTLNVSSVDRAMQDSNTTTLDAIEKRKLQKFSILDTPGVISQRDLVLMTLNASTKTTATFTLKSVVFMCSLADFDITLIDGSDESVKRLHDSLSFFEKTLAMSNNLKDMRRILTFTHVDIFEDRIMNGLSEGDKNRLLDVAGINSTDVENWELVDLIFKWIVSRFEALERKNLNSHKYTLEYYAVNLMDVRDVCELTYHLTMRDGYLRRENSRVMLNVYSSPILSRCEYEIQQYLKHIDTFNDISIKFE